MNEQPPRVTRRRALTIAMAGGLVAAGGSMIAIVGSFLKPKQPTGFGTPVYIGLARTFRRGDAPVHDPENQFWLSNLNPEDRGSNGTDGAAGLLACWDRCPHRGEPAVEWRPDFRYEGTPGWYQCRAHGSVFTRAGLRVFGPSPRSLDTMEVTVGDNGEVTVDTGDITPGGPDNPKRAVDHPLLPK